MRRSSSLPKKISNRYELKKQEKLWGQGSSKKGIYLDKKTNNLVFIKVDTNIKSLLREYKSQQIFYEQSRKLKTRDIIIPKPLEILKVDNYLALVMQYFPIKSPLKVNVKKRVDTYMKVLRFLEKVNTGDNKKYDLVRKSVTRKLITLPYFLSKNLMLYPAYSYLFINSAAFIARMTSRWLKLNSDWLCHGDINTTNVLLYGKKIVIIDFAHSYRSHHYYDISRVLNSTWFLKGFHDEFWNHIVNELNLTRRQQALLTSFVAFNLMQRLSQRYPKRDQELFYLKRLEMIKTSFSKESFLQQLVSLIKKYGFPTVLSIKWDEHKRANGIIFDKVGRKYFFKAAFGKDSYEYKSLCSESRITNYLSSLTKKINVGYYGYRLYIPSVAKIIDQEEILCLITRYVEGRKPLNENSDIKADILLTTLELFAKLSSKTKMSAIRPYLKNYTIGAILLSLPMRFIKAAILSPFATPGLIKVFTKTLPLFSHNNNKYGLVHADINLSNLILQKKAIYLTDWEEAGWGINAYSTITPLCVYWQDQTLREVLLRKLQKNGQKKITIPLLAYRTLMLFNQHIEKGDKRRKRDFMLLKFLEVT